LLSLVLKLNCLLGLLDKGIIYSLLYWWVLHYRHRVFVILLETFWFQILLQNFTLYTQGFYNSYRNILISDSITEFHIIHAGFCNSYRNILIHIHILGWKEISLQKRSTYTERVKVIGYPETSHRFFYNFLPGKVKHNESISSRPKNWFVVENCEIIIVLFLKAS
jgi:hypothetical protein